MGWNGKKDGELLGLLTLPGFEALISVDKGLPHQQNLNRFPITIFVLRAQNNKHQTLQPLAEKVKARISRMKLKVSQLVETPVVGCVVEIS
jgi:hypothetical protein